MKLMKGFFGSGGPETQSVILLRQVPIRYNEPTRSWLGGLPQMPDTMSWPRTDGGAPLQFVAQVCCADLPKEMWGGIGPREGWLLLFVDCYSMEDENHDGNVQVLHLHALGPEREPPEDMGTYRNAMCDYIDYHTPIIRPGIPKMWRRWPVDLVVQDVPEPEEHNGEIVWAPKRVDPEKMYSAPVKREYLRLSMTAETRPLTRRGVLLLLDGLLKLMDTDLRAARNPQASAPLTLEPGFVAGALEKTRARLDTAVEQLAHNEGQLEKRRAEAPADLAVIEARFQEVLKQSREEIASLERNVAELVPYAELGRDVLLAAEVQRANDAHRDWVLARERQVAELRAEVVEQDLDAALPEAEWATIRARLTATRTVKWYVDIRSQSARRSESDLLSRHHRAMEFALREDVLDLYTRDAAGRHLIPPAMLEELLPLVRDIGCGNAPHRMGGPPDAVQEPDTREDRTLLFQMFSDYPIGWMWGDVGALYVTIPKSDLKALRFDRIEADLQGH